MFASHDRATEFLLAVQQEQMVAQWQAYLAQGRAPAFMTYMDAAPAQNAAYMAQQQIDARALSQSPYVPSLGQHQPNYLANQQAWSLQNAICSPPPPFKESGRCERLLREAQHLADRLAFVHGLLGPLATLFGARLTNELERICAQIEDGIASAS